MLTRGEMEASRREEGGKRVWRKHKGVHRKPLERRRGRKWWGTRPFGRGEEEGSRKGTFFEDFSRKPTGWSTSSEGRRRRGELRGRGRTWGRGGGEGEGG
jgi:hypothetical protein